MWSQFNYISIKEILSRAMRNPLLLDLTLETAIQYTVDFFGILGLPSTYIDRVTTIGIKEFRGVMPCDLISINQVRYNGDCITQMTGNYEGNNSFKTQGRIIYTSFKEGSVEISYKAMPLDDEGLPLLPDEPTFLRALELYIKKQWFTILFDMNKISPAVLQNTQQEYAFAVGACNNTFIIPSVSEMEAIKNMWNQLIPRTNEFRNGFRHLGRQEHLKI